MNSETGFEGQDERRVRPYARTRGRTRPSRYLPLEALVVAPSTPADLSQFHTDEEWAIHQICRTPLSIAEVAAHRRLPIGAARVLIGDLANRGLMHISPAATDETERPSHELLQRVLTGLRRY